jgi:Flp pilus assembly pilin Flp
MVEKLLLVMCWAQVLADDGRACVMSRARGQNTVEYSLVAAGIAVLALAVLGILSGAVESAANSAASAVQSAASGASAVKR